MLIKVMRVLIMMKLCIHIILNCSVKILNSHLELKKKIKKNRKMKQNIVPLIWCERLKQLLMRVILMIYLNKCIVQ